MTDTPDPAAIAASLGKRERDALEKLSVLPDPKAKSYYSVRRLASKGLANWWHIGLVITPLGQAVAAAIREAKGA